MHSPLTNAEMKPRFMDMDQQDPNQPPESTVFEIYGDLSTPERQKAIVEAVSKAHKAFSDLGASARSSAMDMEALRASCDQLQAMDQIKCPGQRVSWFRRLWCRISAPFRAVSDFEALVSQFQDAGIWGHDDHTDTAPSPISKMLHPSWFRRLRNWLRAQWLWVFG